DPRIVLGALLAFGLAVGVAAHSFDELRGRPLGTRIPTGVLVALGAIGLAGAAALGVAAVAMLGPLFGVFVAAGVALVLLYALDAEGLIAAPEGALRILWLAVVALAAGLLLSRYI